MRSAAWSTAAVALSGGGFDALLVLPPEQDRPGPPFRTSGLIASHRAWDRGLPPLLEAAAQARVQRVVCASEVFAYGFGDLGPITRDEARPAAGGAVLRGHRPYLASLRAMEERVRQGGGTVLRYGVLHGPDVPQTQSLVRLLRARVPVLPAGGRAVLPFVHVDDVASATADALERAPGGRIYNIADDRPMEFAAYAAAAAYELDLPAPRSVPSMLLRAAAPHLEVVLGRTRLRVSSRRAAAELGWRPRHKSHCGFAPTTARTGG